MDWMIEFYKDEKGNEPVLQFIENLQPPEKAKIIWMIDLLEKTGVNLTEPYSKHIEGSLWELKPQRNRILYFLNKRTFVLLHGFRKTSKKLPVSEKEIALRRMEEYLKSREKL
jgi:phage-related protein